MAATVILSNFDEQSIKSATQVAVKDGHLHLYDRYSNIVAVFAPSTWRQVEVDES